MQLKLPSSWQKTVEIKVGAVLASAPHRIAVKFAYSVAIQDFNGFYEPGVSLYSM